MNLFDQIFNDVITPYLEPRLKKTSIQAVKAYIKSIEAARKVAVTSYGTGIAAASAVAGVVLMLVAIIGLLPLDPRIALVSLFVMGALMTTAAIIIAYRALNQQRWLEMSKSSEMMDAVLNPWPTAYSVPDPRKILGNEAREPALEKESPIAHAAMSERVLETATLLRS